MSTDMLPFDFSISSIAASLLFGIIGYWIFRAGKQRANLPITGIGIALMVYPYFTSGPWGDWGVGIALCGLAYFLWGR